MDQSNEDTIGRLIISLNSDLKSAIEKSHAGNYTPSEEFLNLINDLRAENTALRAENTSLRAAQAAASNAQSEQEESEEELSDFRHAFFNSLPVLAGEFVRAKYGEEFFRPLSVNKRRIAAVCLMNYCSLQNLPTDCLWSNIAANEFYVGGKK